MASTFTMSANGIDQQFAVNHLGYSQQKCIEACTFKVYFNQFVHKWTLCLYDCALKSDQRVAAPIVVLSAVAHEASVPQGVDFETLNDESFSDNMTRQYVHAASHGSLRIRLRNLSRNIYD
ncbi:MAG: hypothetical protein BYD32DRAFT_416555 [Podila humilis]|nr:MAG: hypothetical protein BYD32DRAFT_416555 [Podila humilis]